MPQLEADARIEAVRMQKERQGKVVSGKGDTECWACSKIVPKGKIYYQCQKHAVVFCEWCMKQGGEETITLHSSMKWNDCRKYIFDAMPHDFDMCIYMKQGKMLEDHEVQYAEG